MLCWWNWYLFGLKIPYGFVEILMEHHEGNDFMNFSSINQRIYMGKENGYLGQALLRYMKSTQTIHFSLFFSTTTTLAIHLGNFTSLIILTLCNLLTSSWMIKFLIGAILFLFWCIGLKFWSMFNLWVIISLDIPGIASCFLAKVDFMSFRNLIRSSLISWSRSVPSSTLMSGSLGVGRNSSTSLSLVSRTSRAFFFNFYTCLG